MYKIKKTFQMEVFKQHNDLPTRGPLKIKITVLVVFVVERVTFSSNVLFGVSHIQSNSTTSNI